MAALISVGAILLVVLAFAAVVFSGEGENLLRRIGYWSEGFNSQSYVFECDDTVYHFQGRLVHFKSFSTCLVDKLWVLVYKTANGKYVVVFSQPRQGREHDAVWVLDDSERARKQVEQSLRNFNVRYLTFGGADALEILTWLLNKGVVTNIPGLKSVD